MKKPFSIWLAVTILYLGVCAPFFIVRTVNLININAEHNRLKIIHDEWLLSTDAIKYRQTDAIKYKNDWNNPSAFFNDHFGVSSNNSGSSTPVTPAEKEETNNDINNVLNNDVDSEAWVKAGATISDYANWYNNQVDLDHAFTDGIGISFYAYILLSAVYWIIVWGFALNREKPISND